jgi:hypothetical protein
MYGLGATPIPTADARQEIRANELYFSDVDLIEKRRKLRLIYDSFTDPLFFGDRAVKIAKVQKYLPPDITLTAEYTYTGGRLGQYREAGLEDEAAPWQFTLEDFPNINGQATKNSVSKRSIERLYDDRSGPSQSNVSTQVAIARLIRETLADALYCTSVTGGTGISTPEHPRFRVAGDGLGDSGEGRLALYFPFKEVPSGEDGLEKTYVNAILYIRSYIQLIDEILAGTDNTLSRISGDIETAQISTSIRISLLTETVQLLDAMADTATAVIADKFASFFDETKEYKTLLNLGNDRQFVAEAWRLAPGKTGSLQLKLIKPISNDVDLYDTAFISREVAKSVVDVIEFEPAPEVDTTPYLRPLNTDVGKYGNTKQTTVQATLSTLGLETGSSGIIINGTTVSYGDQVFREWFNDDFNSSELNIDFTDYKNFVSFGSAYARLSAFTEKLLKIEELTSASISSSVSSSIVGQSLKAIEKESIIRGFDPYERFLYFTTQSIAYSASAYYADNEIEYNATGSWPKQVDGAPYSPNSSIATDWLDTQYAIATRFDEFNPNYLVKHIPEHIQVDVESGEFLTFIAMFGHLMDNIKVYIDQFPNIYSTNPNPLEDLTVDQVYEVAKSFGLELPNTYALDTLQSILGDTGSRTLVAETWKRFLHSAIYLGKTKGTRTGLDAILNTYGINSPILQIKETAYAAAGNYVQSDELTYALNFTTGSNFIRLPFVSSSLTASTVQLRFNPDARQASSILTGDLKWAIDLIPHPSSSKLEYGKINVVSGSGRTIIASSSYFPLFSEDYTNIMLRSQSGDIAIIQTDGDQILFQESASVAWGSLWNSTTYAYIGGSGSIKLGVFDGIVDEVLVWGTNINMDDFEFQSYDPGSYYSADYTGSYNDLYVNLSFSQPESSVTQSVTNESPYKNVSIVPTVLVNGFTTASYSRILRSIKQFTPIVGSTVYTNKKVNVVPPPVFDTRFIDANGTKTLSRTNSIKKLDDKVYTAGQNVVSFAISPTDFTNQNIMRSMGAVDVNNIIGFPRNIENTQYSNLEALEQQYVEYYNDTVNPNEYIRFFGNLIEASSQMAETSVPAKAKLLNGIVVESPILSRNKDYVLESIKVDGDNTYIFDQYISGSTTSDVGAYSFDAIYDMQAQYDFTSDTLPLDGQIDLTNQVVAVSSQTRTSLPLFRQVSQSINNFLPSSSVMSSLLNEGSGMLYIESPAMNAFPAQVTSSGYPRNPYLGIVDRLDSENNTTIPFYEIHPRADFYDVGTVTYFHKSNGEYYFELNSLYKEPYIAKFDIDNVSPADQLYSKITLLRSGSEVALPGRYSTTLESRTYTSGSTSTGVVKIANIFSLYALEGTNTSGIRLRLYRNISNRDDTGEAARPFSQIPTGSHGVLFDGIMDGTAEVLPYTLIQTEDSAVYYRLDNTTATEITTNVKMNYFAYEPSNPIPIGYLPRHYKFSRDNTTAIKRRNYLGCRDINTTFDGELPFRVRQSTGNTITANPGQFTPTGDGGIVFSGQGQLNVE